MVMMFCAFTKMEAQNILVPDTANMPVITFEADTIDWGTVEYGSQSYRLYNFMNTGGGALYISQVQTSDPHFGYVENNKPYKKGEKGSVRFIYDTKRVGKTFRYLTVVSNAKNSPKKIYMKVTVLPEKK